MNFQEYADMCAGTCAILSVQKDGDEPGEIRIVCANDSYKKIMGDKFYDNMPYQELVMKDNKFEDFCYRCAILKETLHTYVETKESNNWTEFFMYPLNGGSGDIEYCQFVFNYTSHARTDKLKKVPIEIAEEVIKECIYFHRDDKLEKAMENVCKSILEFSKAKACRVVLLDDEARRAFMFASVLTKDAMPEHIVLKEDEELPYYLVKSWERTLGNSNCFVIKTKKDFENIRKDNPQWYDSLKYYNINSLIMIPLYRQKQIIGYLYIANYDVKDTINIKKLLKLSALFVGSELSSYDLLNKFESLSKVDELTGLLNRNAMNESFARYKESKEDITGIVMFDLNGLKQVNDTYGHFEGDKLIRDGAEIIKEVFEGDKVFRIGGDEFLVIVSDKNKIKFKKKVHKMKNYPDTHISFAIGAYWLKEDENITDAVVIADKLMYINKNEFYLKHPEKDRRS